MKYSTVSRFDDHTADDSRPKLCPLCLEKWTAGPSSIRDRSRAIKVTIFKSLVHFVSQELVGKCFLIYRTEMSLRDRRKLVSPANIGIYLMLHVDGNYGIYLKCSRPCNRKLFFISILLKYYLRHKQNFCMVCFVPMCTEIHVNVRKAIYDTFHFNGLLVKLSRFYSSNAKSVLCKT